MYTLNKKDLIWLDCNEIHKESEILVCIGLSTSILSSIGDIELLGNEGSDRFRALRNECNRRDFVAARVLAKYVASKMTGSSLSDIFIKQFCCGCNQEGHGKPFFFSHPDLHVSWSHQNGVVMVAVAAFPIGVDIETIHSMPVEVDFAKNVLSEEELRFFDALSSTRFDGVNTRQLYTGRQWVRKEALIKLGILSLDRMSTVDLAYLKFPDFSSNSFQHMDNYGAYGVVDFSIAHLACIGSLVWRKEPV